MNFLAFSDIFLISTTPLARTRNELARAGRGNPRYRGHAVRELQAIASAAKHAPCSKVA